MGTRTNSTHARTTVASDTHVEGSRTTSHDKLPARDFLERRITTIEADVAAKVSPLTHRPQTQDEALIMDGLYVCNSQLRRMLTPDWLSSGPVRVSVLNIGSTELTESEIAESEKAKTAIENLFEGISRTYKQDEIRKTGFIVTFISHSACCQPYSRKMLSLLRNLDLALHSDAPAALTKAEGILQRGRRLIVAMAESITAFLEAQSPEALEAKRVERIQRTAEKQIQEYRQTDEYRALRLLTLVQERLAAGEVNTTAETKLAHKLSSQGYEGVERILLDCVPSLQIEESHLKALKELFEKVASAGHSSETTNSDTPQLGSEESSTTTNPHHSEVRAATQEAPEMESASETISIEESPDVIDLKQLLLEELGIKDAQEREYLSRAMTLQGIENTQGTFKPIPDYVRLVILECNPRLLDPTSGTNLVSFCQDLKEFMDQAYDLQGLVEFDPESTPTNFKDHAALKATKKAAAALRIARQKGDGGKDAHS